MRKIQIGFSSTLKTGLVVGAVLGLYTLIIRFSILMPSDFGQFVSMIISVPAIFVRLIGYIFAGVLAGHWMKSPPTIANGAITGALAAFVASLIELIANIVEELIGPLSQVLGLNYVLTRYLSFSGATGVAFCSIFIMIFGAIGGGLWVLISNSKKSTG